MGAQDVPRKGFGMEGRVGTWQPKAPCRMAGIVSDSLPSLMPVGLLAERQCSCPEVTATCASFPVFLNRGLPAPGKSQVSLSLPRALCVSVVCFQ